eukprot:m.112078 g.112078  ORF g.112078 m.112078 type:complete len:1109 (-) comp9246_c1_seq1:135-3461(-)
MGSEVVISGKLKVWKGILAQWQTRNVKIAFDDQDESADLSLEGTKSVIGRTLSLHISELDDFSNATITRLEAFEFNGGESTKASEVTKFSVTVYDTQTYFNCESFKDKKLWIKALNFAKFGENAVLRTSSRSFSMDSDSDSDCNASDNEAEDNDSITTDSDDDDDIEAVRTFNSLQDVSQGAGWEVHVTHSPVVKNNVDIVFKSDYEENRHTTIPIATLHDLVERALQLVPMSQLKNIPSLPTRSAFLLLFLPSSALKQRNVLYTSIIKKLILILGVDIVSDFFFKANKKATKCLLMPKEEAELESLQGSISMKEQVFDDTMTQVISVANSPDASVIQKAVEEMLNAFVDADETRKRISSLSISHEEAQLTRFQSILAHYLGDKTDAILSRKSGFPWELVGKKNTTTNDLELLSETNVETLPNKNSDGDEASVGTVYSNFMVLKTKFHTDSVTCASQRLDYIMRADDVVLSLNDRSDIDLPPAVNTAQLLTRRWRDVIRKKVDHMLWIINGAELIFASKMEELNLLCEARHSASYADVHEKIKYVEATATYLCNKRRDLYECQEEMCKDKISEFKITQGNKFKSQLERKKAKELKEKWSRKLDKFRLSNKNYIVAIQKQLEDCNAMVSRYDKHTLAQRRRLENKTSLHQGMDMSKKAREEAQSRIKDVQVSEKPSRPGSKGGSSVESEEARKKAAQRIRDFHASKRTDFPPPEDEEDHKKKTEAEARKYSRDTTTKRISAYKQNQKKEEQLREAKKTEEDKKEREKKLKNVIETQKTHEERLKRNDEYIYSQSPNKKPERRAIQICKCGLVEGKHDKSCHVSEKAMAAARRHKEEAEKQRIGSPTYAGNKASPKKSPKRKSSLPLRAVSSKISSSTSNTKATKSATTSSKPSSKPTSSIPTSSTRSELQKDEALDVSSLPPPPPPPVDEEEMEEEKQDNALEGNALGDIVEGLDDLPPPPAQDDDDMMKADDIIVCDNDNNGYQDSSMKSLPLPPPPNALSTTTIASTCAHSTSPPPPPPPLAIFTDSNNPPANAETTQSSNNGTNPISFLDMIKQGVSLKKADEGTNSLPQDDQESSLFSSLIKTMACRRKDIDPEEEMEIDDGEWD